MTTTQLVTDPRAPTGTDVRYLTFLDNLRLRGTVNMFGAAPYLTRAFGLPAGKARAVLVYWMQTFSERNGSEGRSV